MIHINAFHPFSLRELETSISGVTDEIHKRQISLSNMGQFLAGTASPKIRFDRTKIDSKIVKTEVDLSKLRVIKAELTYLYELSKLKTR